MNLALGIITIWTFKRNKRFIRSFHFNCLYMWKPIKTNGKIIVNNNKGNESFCIDFIPQDEVISTQDLSSRRWFCLLVMTVCIVWFLLLLLFSLQNVVAVKQKQMWRKSAFNTGNIYLRCVYGIGALKSYFNKQNNTTEIERRNKKKFILYVHIGYFFLFHRCTCKRFVSHSSHRH